MLLSAEELANSSIPLPEVIEFAAANPGLSADWNDVNAIRAVMDTAVAATNSALPAADDILESEITIPMRDGFQSVVKIRKPSMPSAAGSPLIVLAFGGGWIAGSIEQMAVEARAFVRAFSAVVVNISYRLAPQYKFPQGWKDTWDGLVWIAAHATELDADPSRGFIVGGTSAGANLAAVCARKAQIESLPYPLTGQWLNVPTVLREDQIPGKWKHLYVSMQQNADAPIVPSSAFEVLQEHTAWDMSSPWRLPLNSPHALAGLPKTYIQVDGMDCLRDDGLIYDEMLKEAGVESRCDLYAGCPHAHATFVPGKAAESALVDLVKNFGWMLGQAVDDCLAREAIRLL